MPSSCEGQRLEGAMWELWVVSVGATFCAVSGCLLHSGLSPPFSPLSLLLPGARPFLLLLFRMRLKLEDVEDRSQWGSEWGGEEKRSN